MNKNKKKAPQKIDFVILWVDGKDPAWQKEMTHWLSAHNDNGADRNRFRDWNLLRYWFRGVEEFAPWVNHIYFVTCGHYPDWLNLSHEKITLVKHEDFMPADCLPTFNSNAIEMFLHQIPGLSETFVAFNDDMFLTSPTLESDFFINGIPRECALLDAPAPEHTKNILPHTLLNNAAVINSHFHKKEVLRKHFFKFFSPCYGKDLIRNLLLAPLKYFSCFRSPHAPMSHLRESFETLWKLEPELLSATAHHRFRNSEDVTHWLMKDYRLCQGSFIPRATSFSHCFELGIDDIKDIKKAISRQTYKAICINDSFDFFDAQMEKKIQKILHDSMETILAKPSGFELK